MRDFKTAKIQSEHKVNSTHNEVIHISENKEGKITRLVVNLANIITKFGTVLKQLFKKDIYQNFQQSQGLIFFSKQRTKYHQASSPSKQSDTNMNISRSNIFHLI